MFACRLWIVGCALIVVAGCGGPYKEPTIDEFDGRLTHKGQPVQFGADERVILRLVFHKNGERFGVPIQPDGTFDIGWMPIGTYSGTLERAPKPAKGGHSSGMPDMFTIKEQLTIADNNTKYTIELGEDFKR